MDVGGGVMAIHAILVVFRVVSEVDVAFRHNRHEILAHIFNRVLLFLTDQKVWVRAIST